MLVPTRIDTPCWPDWLPLQRKHQFENCKARLGQRRRSLSILPGARRRWLLVRPRRLWCLCLMCCCVLRRNITETRRTLSFAAIVGSPAFTVVAVVPIPYVDIGVDRRIRYFATHMIGVVSPVSPCWRRWHSSGSRSGIRWWPWWRRGERVILWRVERRISVVKVRRGHIRMLCETLLVRIGASGGSWWARIEVAAGCVRWRRRPLRIIGVMRSVRDGILVT